MGGMMTGKLWVRWYRFRPYLIYVLVNLAWVVAALPFVMGATVMVHAMIGWGWKSAVLGVILWFAGLMLLGPVDTEVRKYRHAWRHRHWQGDPPEWRP